MNKIIDLSEARKQKKEKEQQDALKNLPPSYVEYLRVREVQLVAMKNLSDSIDYFEKNILTLSKNRKISGIDIDQYLINKNSLEYAQQMLELTDAKVKEHFPFAEFPTI